MKTPGTFVHKELVPCGTTCVSGTAGAHLQFHDFSSQGLSLKKLDVSVGVGFPSCIVCEKWFDELSCD